MVTILLQKILDLLEAHFPGVITLLSKLNLIEEDTEEMRANVDSMKTTLEDVDTQATAAAGSLNQINTTATSINGNVAAIKNNSEAIKNNVMSMSTNVGNISAYSEATANNTLDIDEKITSIASDTTQIRTNSNSIALNVGKIVEDMEYYFLNNIVTEEVEGDICNFDTDLEDYLPECKVNIPADQTGISGFTITKTGKNICPLLTGTNTNGLTTTVSADNTIHVVGTATGNGGYITTSVNFPFTIKNGTQITMSITNTINANLRLILNNGTIDIPSGTTYSRTTVSNDILSGRLYLFTTANQSYDITFKFQIEIGASATNYEAYKNMSYPVSFGSTITDGAEVDLLEGIAKINTSPVTYLSFQPIAIRTYKGVNNICADVGKTALTYRETLKHYLDKRS